MAEPGPSPQDLERSRRRFARRQWARRWLAWRPVAAVVALLTLVVGGLWLVLFSSVLAVQGVDVRGADQLDPATIEAAAAVPSGDPLARVDLEAVRARVEALAVVKTAEVTRQWPDRVLVRVVEREAIAVVEIGGRVRGMDADGVVFRDYATAPPALPHVRTAADTRGEALREAAQVITALPSALVTTVDYVSVATVDQIELRLRDGRTVVWGSAEDSEQKAEVLEPLLGIEGSRYDVSVPGNATVTRAQ